MKAIVQHEYGPPDVLTLQDIDQPNIGADEILVRVHAAGVNFADPHIMRGVPFMLRLVYGPFKPKTKIRGSDVAGTVEAVGEDVTRFAPGDEVFGWCTGAFAEYARAEEDHFVHKPARLTFEQAAAVGVAAFTALQAVRDVGRVQPGQRVLVNGASGGVGTFAVQISKAFGAEVTGVCSTKNIEMVRSIGADEVIDYTKEDFTRTGQRYDLILDNVGNHSLTTLRKILTPKGTLIPNDGDTGIGGLIAAFLLTPFVSQRIRRFISLQKPEDLVVLEEMVEAGKITPIIDRTYSLGDTPEALKYFEEGHTSGKIVITVGA